MAERENHTYLNEIGRIQLRRSVKARYMRIKISPVGEVSIVIPSGISEKQAMEFAHKKKGWILQSVQKQKNKKYLYTFFNEETPFKTRNHVLQLKKHEASTIKTVVSGNNIHVYYPSFASVTDPRVQQVIRKAIEETWRIEAKKYIPHRVKELADMHNFSFNRVSIKNTKTRWGSCSVKNNINLSLEIMRLPDKLIDYIILHELVHTVQKNHQKGFWNLLEKVLPGAKLLDKELNKYHLKIW